MISSVAYKPIHVGEENEYLSIHASTHDISPFYCINAALTAKPWLPILIVQEVKHSGINEQIVMLLTVTNFYK